MAKQNTKYKIWQTKIEQNTKYKKQNKILNINMANQNTKHKIWQTKIQPEETRF